MKCMLKKITSHKLLSAYKLIFILLFYSLSYFFIKLLSKFDEDNSSKKTALLIYNIRRKSMIKKVMFMITIICFCSVFMYAQEAKTYIGPQLGWQKASDADNGKFMPGGAIRIKLTKSLGVEGSINYRQEEYQNSNIKVTSWPVMVTGLIYPIKTIYGAIGVGWYNTSIDYSKHFLDLGLSNDTQQKFGWHFGAGAEIPLSESRRTPGMILTTDFRYVFLNYNFTEVPGSNDINSDYFIVTVGLLFNI